jgi:hypothetical protein
MNLAIATPQVPRARIRTIGIKAGTAMLHDEDALAKRQDRVELVTGQIDPAPVLPRHT